MKTSTEKKPTLRVPSMTILPPISRVIVKPIRIAMRISGTKAELRRMASRVGLAVGVATRRRPARPRAPRR